MDRHPGFAVAVGGTCFLLPANERHGVSKTEIPNLGEERAREEGGREGEIKTHPSMAPASAAAMARRESGGKTKRRSLRMLNCTVTESFGLSVAKPGRTVACNLQKTTTRKVVSVIWIMGSGSA